MPKVSVTQIDEINTCFDQTDYPISQFLSILPFRVRFTNIGFPRNEPTDVPPIGLAVVGINNYIL